MKKVFKLNYLLVVLGFSDIAKKVENLMNGFDWLTLLAVIMDGVIIYFLVKKPKVGYILLAASIVIFGVVAVATTPNLG